jgi:hypothetical protein
MYRRVLAFDFDGTLAVGGRVAPALETALEQCRNNGHVLFLVTGRRYETVSLGRCGPRRFLSDGSPLTTCGDDERENLLNAQHASGIVRSMKYSVFLLSLHAD